MAPPDAARPDVPPAARLWLAFACFFRILFDGAFAARVRDARHALPAPEPAAPTKKAPKAGGGRKPARPDPSAGEASAEKTREVDGGAPPQAQPARNREEAALVLLSLLQREGRLVDFVQQDIDGFADDEIGAAARVLHAGCRKALRHHAAIEPVRPEEEDSRVAITEGVESGAVKLVGAVGGKPPYRGTLRHRGWRVTLSLPEPTAGHDATVVAPAEVEL